DETLISINNELETVKIRNPFFAAFNGPTKSVFLLEPGSIPDDDGVAIFSDEIFLTQGGTVNAALTFGSDVETQRGSRINCTLNTVVCIPETGGPQDVAKLIFGDKSGFLVLNVISDVPAPSAALLLGTGLVALLRRCVSRLRGPLRARRDGVRQSAWDA